MVLVVTVIAALLVPDAAAADTRPGVTPTSGCVTRPEWNHLHHGMARAEVYRLLDWEGGPVLMPTVAKPRESWRIRTYRGCKGSWGSSRIYLWFRHGRLNDALWFTVH